jgi:hypothetical protein
MAKKGWRRIKRLNLGAQPRDEVVSTNHQVFGRVDGVL